MKKHELLKSNTGETTVSFQQNNSLFLHITEIIQNDG